MTRLQSRKSILMSGTAALVALAAVATAALAADISTTGYQDLVNDQKMLSPEVKALIDATGAANAVADRGAVLSSRVELVGENQSAVAIANSADQTMAVDRASIELAPPVPYDLSEEPVGYVGHETVVSNGAFNVLSNQELGYGSIIASGMDVVNTIGVTGGADSSALVLDGNAVSISALGNDVSNGLFLSGAVVATVASVNNLQTSLAGIDATLGGSGEPYEAAITIGGDVTDSALSITRNAAGVSTVANRAVNALAVEAATLRGGGSAYEPIAGRLVDGVGADGVLVLANMQTVDIGGADGGAGPGVSATAYGYYAISTGEALDDTSSAIEGNSQSARIFGNTAVNALSVSAARLDRAGGELPVVGIALSSAQSGNGDLTALSQFDARISASSSRSTLSISGNDNLALARMNEADNSVTLRAARIDGSSYAGVLDGAAYGDDVLFNDQHAQGTVTAHVASSLGTLKGSGSIEGSTFAVDGNLTASEATANRAVNTLSVTSAAGLGAAVALGSQQKSSAEVQSTTEILLNVSSGGARNVSLAMNDNTTTALARGNAVENSLTLVSGSVGADDEGPKLPMLMGYSSAQPSAVMLSNWQDNQGSVTARSSGLGSEITLTCDCVDSSRLSATGMTSNAAAYGNAALNEARVSGGRDPHLAEVMNYQTNDGVITATVVEAIPAVVVSGFYGSSATIAGNIVSATAIGNQVMNSISTR